MKNFLLLILFLSVVITAQNKKAFDIVGDNGQEAASFAKVSGSSIESGNGTLAASLLEGGYFTIGTEAGISQGYLDDNCSITFGHPYAKTSYPVFSLDGIYYKLDDFFSDSEIKLAKRGDTLEVAAERAGTLSIIFTLSYSADGKSVLLNQKIKNLDNANHNISAGFAFDPSLGEWGDGSLLTENGFITTNSMYSASVPDKLTLWEKSSGAKGINLELTYGSNPEKIIAANWNEIYSSDEPSDPDLTKKLYDLYLKLFWQQTSFSAGTENNYSMTVSLKEPDFSSSLFLRWDLQTFLDVQNNIVFPENFNTYLQVNKKEASSSGSVEIQLQLPATITSSTSGASINIDGMKHLQKINLRSHIVYDDKVVELVARVLNGVQLIDEIRRQVYVPATPVSDSGLVVQIDSLDTSKFPDVEMKFEARIKSNDYKIGNLTTENILVYEDHSKVETFELSKDTTGGVNAADIVFVLDVTGSMGDEIDKVKSNIIEFADSLSFRGIDYRLGLITFLDEIENTYPFTNDAQYFQGLIASQYAHGGGDEPENSLLALFESTKFSYRINSNRIVVWITDATYHENNSNTSLTKTAVVNALLASGITVHAIGPEYNKSGYYDPIINPTGGNFYDIYGNFRDILLDISRFGSSGKYFLKYRSQNLQMPGFIKLVVRYAGLGGQDSTGTVTNSAHEEKYLSFYPNPFNPEVTFRVNKGNFSHGELRIFNMLGEQIKIIPIRNTSEVVSWNAKSGGGDAMSSGLYIVQLVLNDGMNHKHTESAKILYLK